MPETSTIEKAYGLLWRETRYAPIAAEARKLLLAEIDKEGQSRGIAYAAEMHGPVSDHEALRDFP